MVRMTEGKDAKENPEHHVRGLFLANSGTLRGFVGSLLPDPALVDDVLQETFRTVTAEADSFTPGTNFKAWACRIARIKVLEARRKAARQENLLSAEVIEALAGAEQAIDSDLPDSLLRECLKELEPTARRAIALHYDEGKTHAEVAETMAWQPHAASVTLSRARTALRDCIELKQQETREPA